MKQTPVINEDHQDIITPEVTCFNDVAKKVYFNKSSNESSYVSQSIDKSQVDLKLDKPKKIIEYSGSKFLKRKGSDSSLSSLGQVKRGPGRPKKVLKEDGDNNNGNADHNVTEKKLKLNCSSKNKHKISNSSSSDLSPPVLEPWIPFSPRKDSTRTPPTLSPISSTKLSDIQKSSDDEKLYETKIAKKHSTSSTLVWKLFIYKYTLCTYCINISIFID